MGRDSQFFVYGGRLSERYWKPGMCTDFMLPHAHRYGNSLSSDDPILNESCESVLLPDGNAADDAIGASPASQPAAVRPQAQARVGDEKDIFTTDAIETVTEFLRIVARGHGL